MRRVARGIDAGAVAVDGAARAIGHAFAICAGLIGGASLVAAATVRRAGVGVDARRTAEREALVAAGAALAVDTHAHAVGRRVAIDSAVAAVLLVGCFVHARVSAQREAGIALDAAFAGD